MSATADLSIDGTTYRFKLRKTGAGYSAKFVLTITRSRRVPLLWQDEGYEWVYERDSVTSEVREMVEDIIEPDDAEELLNEAMEQMVEEFEEVEP